MSIDHPYLRIVHGRLPALFRAYLADVAAHRGCGRTVRPPARDFAAIG